MRINELCRLVSSACRVQRGSTAIEYAVIAALVTLAIVGALTVIDEEIGAMLERVAGYFT